MSAQATPAPTSLRSLPAGVFTLAMALFTCSPVLVQADSPTPNGALVSGHQPITAALARYASFAELTPARAGRAPAMQSAPRKSFVKRHPVWSGLIVGSGTGTTVAAATWGAEGASVGLYSGAAVGALVGWLIAR